MHEYNMVKSLLEQVDEIRSAEGADRVTRVCVSIGPLSGVEPLLLQSAFEHLKADTSMADAELIVEPTKMIARCLACGLEFEMHDYCFRCRECGESVQLLQGDRFFLDSVSVAATDSAS